MKKILLKSCLTQYPSWTKKNKATLLESQREWQLQKQSLQIRIRNRFRRNSDNEKTIGKNAIIS